MRKKIIYAAVTLMVCIGSSSFKQECNDSDAQASYKEKIPVKVKLCPAKVQQELSISPLNNLLEI